MTRPKTDNPQGQKLTTQRINEMAFSFRHTGTLVAAIELGLFTMLSENPSGPAEIAEKMGVPTENAERLMIACVTLHLLEKRGSKYVNVPDVDRYLVKGKPAYFGDYLAWQTRNDYDSWKNIASIIKPPKKRYDEMKHNPQVARAFTVAGYNSSISAGHKLAREFDFSQYSLFLDLGGGSGCYSIAAALRYPNLHCIVFDFPTVTAVAEEYIAEAGLSDRVKTHPGDFSEDPLPRGADLVAYITPLQVYEKDNVQFLINKAFDAVEPGGAILILDYMLNDDKTGPLDSVFRHLGGLSPARQGRVNTPSEFHQYLSNSGFVDIEVSENFLPGSLGKVIGRKPG